MEKLSQADIRKFVAMGASHRALIKLLVELEEKCRKDKK